MVEARARAAGAGDEGLLLAWANDPVTRANSFHPEPIAREEHAAWFQRQIADGRPILLIVELYEGDRWMPRGHVRVDAEGVVSLVVAPEARGRGLGRALLSAGIDEVLRGRTGRELRAFVKPDNVPSRRVFAATGFREAGRTTVAGVECVRYELP